VDRGGRAACSSLTDGLLLRPSTQEPRQNQRSVATIRADHLLEVVCALSPSLPVSHGRPDVFTAFRVQLGLKLEPARRAVAVLVIEPSNGRRRTECATQ
jgi:hypothetical protein